MGSYLRLIDGVYHSTLSLRVMKKKGGWDLPVAECGLDEGAVALPHSALIAPKINYNSKVNCVTQVDQS